MNGLITLKIIWASLLGSLGIYAFVLLTVSKNWAEPSPIELDPITLALIGGAIVSSFASAFVLKIQTKNIPKNIELTFEKKIQHFHPAYIASLAFTESIAIMGFVLAFTKQNPSLYWPFASAAVGLFILKFPSEEKINNYFKTI